jgi:hypothetical protein
MNKCSLIENRSGLHLVQKPVQRAEQVEGLREGSTGRLIPSGTVGPVLVMLPRVMAVGEPVVEEATQAESAPELPKPAAELAFYRKYTEALLRRYLRLSTQAGRVPSLMGREIFRGNVTHYRATGLEDVVIFCHDVERRLEKLNRMDRSLIRRVVLQRYTKEEAAVMIGISLRSLIRYYDQAIDRVTEMLLESGLLDPKRL